jgi:hypothetical protein
MESVQGNQEKLRSNDPPAKPEDHYSSNGFGNVGSVLLIWGCQRCVEDDFGLPANE